MVFSQIAAHASMQVKKRQKDNRKKANPQKDPPQSLSLTPFATQIDSNQ